MKTHWKEDFYSPLTELSIDEKEYEYTQRVWNHFNCQTLREYSNLYLKINVLLLADIFENIRNISGNGLLLYRIRIQL